MAILVCIEKLPSWGDCQLVGFKGTEEGASDWFVADSFSFGVERELKESGEKGGTSDINIGIGELQECSIGKSMDRCSGILAQAAINGTSLGTAHIAFVQAAGGDSVGAAKPMIYLLYKLDRCFVKTWSISGDADDRPTEEVAFLYNKIAFQYCATTDGVTFEPSFIMGWDNISGKKWVDHAISATSAGIPNPKAGA